MVVMFDGGGPAQGLFKTMADKDEIRVATPQLLDEGEAAFYVVAPREHMASRYRSAVANFVGYRPSAASLVDFVIHGHP